MERTLQSQQGRKADGGRGTRPAREVNTTKAIENPRSLPLKWTGALFLLPDFLILTVLVLTGRCFYAFRAPEAE